MENTVTSFIKQTVWSLTLLAGVIIGSFLLFNVAPGEPARIILGPNASVEAVARLSHELGTDRPLWEQWTHHVKRVFTFDLGRSIIDGRSVANEVLSKFLVSAKLGVLAAIFAVVLSYLINFVAFINSRMRRLIDLVSLGVVLPTFFTGVVAALTLGVWFPIVSLSGYGTSNASWTALLLPAFVAAFYPIAIMTKVLHEKIVAVSGSDFARAATALGFSKVHIFHRVLLRSVSVSWLATWVNQLSTIFIASFILEVIFTIPGVGSLLVRTVQDKDFPMLQGMLLVNAIFFITLYWVSDIVLSRLDPRLRLDGAS